MLYQLQKTRSSVATLRVFMLDYRKGQKVLVHFLQGSQTL